MADKKEDSDRNNLSKDIDIIRSIISDNKVENNGVWGEITHLEYQVIAAQRIVKLIDNQDFIKDSELLKLEQQLAILNAKKEQTVKQYQSLLLEEYKSRNHRTKLYFLASSKNLSEFLSRINHLQTLKEFRKKQLRALLSKQQEVADKVLVHKGNEDEKTEIARAKTEQIGKLNELLRKKHQSFKKLESESNVLHLRLNEKMKQLDDLDKKVSASIKQSVKSAKKVVIGKLKWPVKSGLLVERFGVHRHSKERKVKVANNGIDVLVKENSKVYAVGDGIVKAVLLVPGSNTSIILDHGLYYSVYSNLKGASLKVGDEVSSGVELALIAQDDEGISKLHFELWKGVSKVNPVKYLEGSLN